ncbi:MAG: GxxExxY protein [Prevotella sp.]|nr:GxxExxY protein [Prevotella sp.]
MEDNSELIRKIIACARIVRRQLAAGYEEKIYKNAMFIEMKKHGILVETEVPFDVRYDNIVIGQYRADMIADRRVIVELKAVSALIRYHSVQLVNYLTATGLDDGVLINFGSEKLEIIPRTRLYNPNTRLKP